MERLERAIEELKRRRVGVGIVLKPQNIYYLTGFYPTAFAVLLLEDEPSLLVSPMDEALASRSGVEVEVVRSFRRRLRRIGGRRVGIEKGYASFEFWERYLRGRQVVSLGFIEEMRMVKDGEELRRIRASARVAEKVLGEVEALLDSVRSERELAARAEYLLRREAGSAFEVIVASGKNSSIPHHTPAGELDTSCVIVDLGARVEHYASDITRTFSLSGGGVFPELYEAVLEAQRAAIERCVAGATAGDVDRAAREVLREYRLERHFLHSTGHGIGLEVHEAPRLSRGSRMVLREGMVVTVEPGVYRELGVRVEDMVLIGKRPKLITSYRK
ncbi:MAG: M24 family metallopeptidase [Euryarchaeota archaeon]|nr:M24 family metallopeptidase [Euryarchaeota archaeon]